MARSLRSLRQVATLRHGHMARRSASLRSCIHAFRALGVFEHIWLQNKKFDPSCFDPIQKFGMSTWGLTLIFDPVPSTYFRPSNFFLPKRLCRNVLFPLKHWLWIHFCHKQLSKLLLWFWRVISSFDVWIFSKHISYKVSVSFPIDRSSFGIYSFPDLLSGWYPVVVQ